MGLALLTVILFVPALTGALALWENLRTGEIRLQRRLLGGRLTAGYARAFVNSVWTLWLTMLALPFGRSAVRPGGGAAAGGSSLPPVILVHGLYHNPAAWFVMRRRLSKAGFADVRCHAYGSFGPDFAAIAADLALVMVDAAREASGGRVLLMGHSLGGLLVRAACAEPCVAAGGCRVAGVVTLGSPHRGSTLAGMLGLGRLARSLSPQGGALERLRGLPACAAPGLSLYSPTDGMVLPLSGSFLEARELAAGWEERALAPTSHVGLLYSRGAWRAAREFLLARAREAG
jgi:pimeloyl-ACP methyl ester carboxylesterase